VLVCPGGCGEWVGPAVGDGGGVWVGCDVGDGLGDSVGVVVSVGRTVADGVSEAVAVAVGVAVCISLVGVGVIVAAGEPVPRDAGGGSPICNNPRLACRRKACKSARPALASDRAWARFKRA
jgi:hypothetical protein